MLLAILLLLLIVALFGVGIAVKAAVWLVWFALILGLLWIIGWFIGGGASDAGRRRWYSW